MTSPDRPYEIRLSVDEVSLLQDALWIWEDGYRNARLDRKRAGDVAGMRECDQKISAIRNVKARLFRLKGAQP